MIQKAMTFRGLEQSCKNKRTLEEMCCDMINSKPGDLGHYDCPVCLNRGGSMTVNESGCYSWVPCDCMKIRDTMKRINKAGLGDLAKRYTFDNYVDTKKWQEEAKRSALQFLENPEGKWFFIGGQSGSGKTHLCTALTISLIKQKKKQARYMKWREEVTRLNAVVNDEIAYRRHMDALKTTELLYIDDFFKTGKVQPTAAEINKAFELLDYRYSDKRLITIISSERSIEQIFQIDEATGGRILDMAKENYVFLTPSADKNFRTRRRNQE